MINKSKGRNLLLILSIIGIAVLFTGCASQPNSNAYNPPGFLLGIVHGFLFIISFFGSLFLDIRMYAFPNSGIMYDLGYIIGVSLFAAATDKSAS